MPNSAELGLGFKSIGRGLKKVGRGAGKVGKVAVKTGVAAGKLYAKLYLLPLQFAVKAAVKVGRTLCKAPRPLLDLAASQANVDPAFVTLFCKAINEGKISVGSVRRLLPPALKVASKLAATGAFPPIVPVLAVVKYLPFIGQFAGSAEADLGSYASDLRNIRSAVDTLEIFALSDHLGLLDEVDASKLGLSSEDRQTLQSHLAAATSQGTLLPFALAVCALGGVVYFGLRK